VELESSLVVDGPVPSAGYRRARASRRSRIHSPAASDQPDTKAKAARSRLAPRPRLGPCRRANGATDRSRAATAPTATTASPTTNASSTRRRSTAQDSWRSNRRKQTGADPTHDARAAARRAEANVNGKREAREWDEQHGKLVDLSAFQRDILPLIQEIPLSRLQRATGLSLHYVSLIRRGERTPHPRHWQALIGCRPAARTESLTVSKTVSGLCVR